MRDKLFSNIRFRVLLSAFFALILLFVVFGGRAQKTLNNNAFNFFDPLFKSANSVNNFFENIAFLFADKKRLDEENEYLREMVANLKGNLESIDVIKNDNKNLRSMLGRGEEASVLADIILRPPESIYDTIIIDAGKNNGVEAGMRVITPEGIYIGNISEVFDNASKVTLASYFNKETNVFLENIGIPTIAVGIGAETMQIQLPRDAVSIDVGERVLTTGGVPRLIGFVEEIKTKSTDPLQTVLLRTPFNINNIKSVLVI